MDLMTQYFIATRGGSLHIDEIKAVPGLKVIAERSKFHVLAESELDVDALRELLPNYIVEAVMPAKLRDPINRIS